MQDFTRISYVVDAADELVSVSPEWWNFALMNDGDDLSRAEVIGQSLWDFIGDDPTRDLYEAILAHVRTGATTDLVLRCDGPSRRRLIEMTVTRLPNGHVEFTTVLLAAKSRAVQRLFSRSTPRCGGRVLVCSWCDQVNVEGELWAEVEIAMDELHLTDEPELPRIESVVCPSCFQKVMETLAQSKPPVDIHPFS